MKKMKKILKPLDLIYYEYDQKENVLLLDKNWTPEYTFSELIKITSVLSKNHINFFIDENQSIVIAKSDSFIAKIKRFFASLASNIKNSKMHIYILNNKKIKWAKNLPVIEIKPIEQAVDFSPYDAIVFTSKNAVYALDAIDKTWKNKPAYAIAPQTAKIVKFLGGNLKFVGREKHGNEFALEIVENFKEQKVLYVRAAKVVSDLASILNKNDVVCEELIVYETICKEFEQKVTLPENSTIIFSSPSTVECFFKNVSWHESFKAVSIGKTTAKYLPENITPIISDTPSFEFCVKKAIELNS